MKKVPLIIGLVRRLLDDGPDAAGEYIAEVRAAIDA